MQTLIPEELKIPWPVWIALITFLLSGAAGILKFILAKGKADDVNNKTLEALSKMTLALEGRTPIFNKIADGVDELNTKFAIHDRTDALTFEEINRRLDQVIANQNSILDKMRSRSHGND